MAQEVNLRALALETLLLFEKDREKANELINSVLEKYEYLPKNQRAFYARLTEGTLEEMIWLDYLIDCYSKTPVRKMKPVIRNILRLSFYQIRKMDSVPDRAAVNEAVKLTVKKGFGNLKGFVNGVLRSALREPDKALLPKEENTLSFLSVKYSMPEFLLEKWLKDYGKEKTRELCESFLKEKKTYIRFRGSERRQEECIAELKKEGISVEATGLLPYACSISGFDKLGELSAFERGDFLIQDISSMLAIEAAGIEKESNLKILDLCAAPGGKTLLAADKAGEGARLYARDVSEEKVELIRENAEKCGIKNVEIQVFDAKKYDSCIKEKMDLVIADLPCSGYGVIGHKPDIKYRASEENEENLVQLQRKILDNAVAYVKPGGKLLYSTCTINQKENEDQVSYILEKGGFKVADIRKNMPKEILPMISPKGSLQLLPGKNYPGDGFFITLFVKDEVKK